MNIIALLEVASAVASKGNASQTLSDARLLYGLYQGGKPDLAAMTKVGTLEPAVAALRRLSATVDDLLLDKDHAPQVAALLESLQ